MRVLVATANPLVDKSGLDKRIGIDHIAAVNNDRVGLPGQSLESYRVKVPVLLVTGEDNDRISAMDGIVKTSRNRHTGIFVNV